MQNKDAIKNKTAFDKSKLRFTNDSISHMHKFSSKGLSREFSEVVDKSNRSKPPNIVCIFHFRDMGEESIIKS